MQTPSPEQSLEIARRIQETFSVPERWHQGGWGRDDDGDIIDYDGSFYIVDNDDVHHPAAFRLSTPNSPRCLCLAAAILIHTASVLSRDPANTGKHTEAICSLYTRLARIDTIAQHKNTPHLEPHLNSIIDWNDSDDRSYDDVRDLTATVLHHLRASR